jgi:RNA polymerase sigma factor (sigma-70 family)
MREQTDGELIAASQHDPFEFGAIFERHHVAVFSYIDRRLGRGAAEDVVAETFAEAFRTRARYDSGVADCRPWLFGIATNLLRRHWRNERRQLRAYARTGQDPANDPIDRAEERADAQGAGHLLAAALARLSRDQRDVLMLHVFADLSDAEIAAALTIPVGTVRSRLSRARARLRERLAAVGQ